MPRLVLSVFGVVVTVVTLAVPAQGAAAAPVPPNDFVFGGGETAGTDLISVSAVSDALGGSPSGFVAGLIFFRPAPFGFDFPVSCLAVHGNRAVIGAGPLWVGVIDNGSAGSPPDFFVVAVGPTDCSSEHPPGPVFASGSLVSGDIVVFDAPSKAQCRDGGWRNYTDAAGEPFTNQGRCIAFALGVA